MPRLLLRAASLAALATLAPAQLPTVGDRAPALVASTWLNWEGAAPTLESQKGRVVLLEFWGTWCGPCVRAMPGIQKLHDRYRERGLTVLAITYEEPRELAPFLAEHRYTLPIGSDPEKATIAAYGIRSWPTTVVIDKVGKVAHVGSPYDAETAVERALGLEAGPAALWTAYLDASKQSDEAEQRAALERLVEKATADFDLHAWAKSQLEPEVSSGEGAVAQEEPPKTAVKPAEAAEVLQRCVEAWKGGVEKRTPLLEQLAASAPSSFDLAAFARELYANEFPLEADELKELLEEERFAAAVEAIAQRAPSAKVLGIAAKHRELAAFCKAKAPEARSMAKRGLMAELWVFPLALPKDEEVNRAFFDELTMSGISQTSDKKTILGVILGAEVIGRERVAGFVRDRLTEAILMDDLAQGKAPKVRELGKLLEQERKQIVRDLESRYGKPEPRDP